MLFRNEAKVGLIIFIAIVALIGVYWFLGGLGLRARTYEIHAIFSDARKLDVGADVRMAGVKIGRVEDISLTGRSRARITMTIKNGYKIPADSIARITTGGFIGDNYIEIMPGSSKRHLKPGDEIKAAELVQFSQILTDVSGVLGELKRSAESINEIIGDKNVIKDTKQTIAELKSAAQSASELIASARGVVAQSSPDIRSAFQRLDAAMASAENVMANAEHVSQQIDSLVAKDAAPAVRRVMSSAASAVEELSGAITEAKELVGSFKGAASTANEALAKINVVAEEANQMMKKLNEASGGIRDLATDKQLMEELKRTVKNTADATEQAKQLITSLNCRFGGYGSRGPTPQQKAAIPDYGLTTNSLWNVDRGKYRFDANYTFAGRGNSFYRIGAYNIGESTKLNLQGGMTLNSWNAFRYGLYASRLGVGYDVRPLDRLLISADIFRPNDPQLEVRGVLGITDSLGIYGGVRDWLNDGPNEVLVGVQYQK